MTRRPWISAKINALMDQKEGFAILARTPRTIVAGDKSFCCAKEAGETLLSDFTVLPSLGGRCSPGRYPQGGTDAVMTSRQQPRIRIRIAATSVKSKGNIQ